MAVASLIRSGLTNSFDKYRSALAGNVSIFNLLSVQYLVVAGGGAGGASFGSGAGAGGLLTNSTTVAINTSYTVTIGAGGSGGLGTPSNVRNDGNQGNDSIFSTIRALKGGGGGGNSNEAHTVAGGNGVVGSGGGGQGGSAFNVGATGTPGQGNNGGNGTSGAGSGGGGAGSAGSGVNAGIGLQQTWTNTSTYFAGGGVYSGGTVSLGRTAHDTAGAANTGAGAGGGDSNRSGGSGIVVLRYPNTYTVTTTGLVASTATVGSDKVTTITGGNGNISWT
jgi:hypothetical protein